MLRALGVGGIVLAVGAVVVGEWGAAVWGVGMGVVTLAADKQLPPKRGA